MERGGKKEGMRTSLNHSSFHGPEVLNLNGLKGNMRGTLVGGRDKCGEISMESFWRDFMWACVHRLLDEETKKNVVVFHGH